MTVSERLIDEPHPTRTEADHDDVFPSVCGCSTRVSSDSRSRFPLFPSRVPSSFHQRRFLLVFDAVSPLSLWLSSSDNREARERFNTGRWDRGPCWQPCRDLEVSRLSINFLVSSGILLLDLPPHFPSVLTGRIESSHVCGTMRLSSSIRLVYINNKLDTETGHGTRVFRSAISPLARGGEKRLLPALLVSLCVQ